MRLINGDRLLMKLKQNRLLFLKACGDFSSFSEKDKSRVDEIDNCIAEIVNAPTIDPEELRPKGRWIVLDECSNAGVYCSNCHKAVYKEHYKNVKIKSNYCPKCGAKMEVEQ